MTLNEFISAFAAEFTETSEDQFTANTNFKSLEEWDSVMALSIISMVDDQLGKRITGNELRSCTTIEELFTLLN